MPFGATFWASGWEAVLHPHVFDDAVETLLSSNSDWRKHSLEQDFSDIIEIIQGPMSENVSAENIPRSNLGFFEGRKVGDHSIVLRIGVTDPEPDQSQIGHINEPVLDTVDLVSFGITDRNEALYQSPYYRVYDPYIEFYTRADGGSGTFNYDLYHVQPIAFRGVVSEVIGALLMYSGCDTDYIDQDSFDAAYDLEMSLGADNGERPYVWVIPQQGETIIKTIKRVCAHWNHLLVFDQVGRIALVPASESPLTGNVVISQASNIKALEFDYSSSEIKNKSSVMHCALVKRWNESNTAPAPDFGAAWEPQLKSDIQGAFVDDYVDQDSIDMFGERELGEQLRQVATAVTTTGAPSGAGRKPIGGPLGPRVPYPSSMTVMIAGDTKNIFHLALFSLKTIKDLFMERFFSNETQQKVRIKITQDLLGLDQDLGSIISVYDLDNELRNYRVVKQTIDYNSLTVITEGLEELGTEYSLAGSSDIWLDMDPTDAPIGTTVLTESLGTIYLDVNLTTSSSFDWFYQIKISKDGAAFIDLTLGWDANTGSLDETFDWAGDTERVDIIIRACDYGSAAPLGQEIATPWITMPPATR